MAVEAKDVVFFFGLNRAEDDATTEGGGVDKSAKVTFEDVITTGTASVVGEDTADTALSLAITGRDSTGALITENLSTHGTDARTKVVSTNSFERLIKVFRAAGTPTGALAVMCDLGLVTGTVNAASTLADYADLETADVQADDFYKGWVYRHTSGANIGQLREVVKYSNSLNRVYFRNLDAGNIGAAETYELGAGFVLEHSGQMGGAATTIDFVGRPFYNVAADPAVAKTFYSKIFAYNVNAATTLSNATISEDSTADATLRAKIGFDLETTLDGTDSSTKRVTDPGGYTYDDGPNNVANSKNFSPNSGQGVWMRLSLSAGDTAQNAEYGLQVNGQTT